MYHLNEAGEALRCKATQGRCPYSAADHFSSKEEARNAFEKLQDGSITSVSRTVAHKMALSSDVVQLLERLCTEGLTPYVVGGSVRDSLFSGDKPKDIDIEVFDAKNMDNFESLLKKAGYRVDSVGKSFGVLIMKLPNGEDIDISLPRIDSKKGDGHRGFDVKVDPTLSIEEAAGRRDFTINALYYSHKDGLVKDPYGGLEDYRKGELRHINKQFADDPLRVIRAVQFSARFKMKLHPETAEFCQSLRKEYKTLPASRLQTEFDKLLSKGDVAQGLATLKETGWDSELKLADLPQNVGDEANASAERAREAQEDTTLFAATAILKASNENDRRYIAEYMLTGGKRQKKAIVLAETEGPKTHSEKDVKTWARNLALKSITAKDYYIASGDAKTKASALKAGSFYAPVPDILTGAKIIEQANLKPGPWMGKLLKEANQAQNDEVFTNDEEAKDWLHKKLSEL